MNEYLIGAGALLTAGTSASVAPATLHARVHPALAAEVKAFLVDFEGSRKGELSRLLIGASGWNAERFAAEVTAGILAQGECALADVLRHLARAVGAGEVHCFARWLPDPATTRRLSEGGIGIAVHPLEAIDQAALVCGQRAIRWAATWAA